MEVKSNYMKIKNKKGQYTKHESGYTTFMVSLFVVGYIMVIAFHSPSEPITIVSAEEKEPEVVQIEVRINWTQERIEKEIRKVFHEEPDTFVRIAECESKFKSHAFNPTNKSNDMGILQVSERYHKEEYTRLGFTDMHDIQQNLQFSRILYDKNKAKGGDGKADWSASFKCWSR